METNENICLSNTANLSVGKKRILWIDCAKLVAIMAVVIDHAYAFLYANANVRYLSWFSVTLFVLLSGVSCYYQFQNGTLFNLKTQIKRILKLLAYYAGATAVVLVFLTGFFDLKVFLGHLFNFSISNIYYYFVFFIQLMLVAPLLLCVCKAISEKKLKILYHIVVLALLGFIAALCIKYTFILPVHGGGMYLFGATYLLVFYIGMMLMSLNVFTNSKNKKIIILAVSAVTWVLWAYLRVTVKLPFDTMMSDFWGSGVNPPSVNIIIESILLLFVCYAFFSLLENTNNKFCKAIVTCCSFCGKKTLFIFMFHYYVMLAFGKYLAFPFSDNYLLSVTLRVVLFILIVLIPVLMDIITHKTIKACTRFVKKGNS